MQKLTADRCSRSENLYKNKNNQQLEDLHSSSDILFHFRCSLRKKTRHQIIQK